MVNYTVNPRGYPASEIRDGPKPQMEINIEDEKFIISHAYTGTQTIREIYEDFLKRKIENT